MSTSQSFIPIDEIKDGLIYLADGSVSLVILTSAVNFGLLFETEQLGLIDAFARLLNSLSFPIQIVIHSKRLDVSSYLHTLDAARDKQTNPRLQALTASYRRFVESIIKERNVLDKQFYVCLNVTAPELGLLPHKSADQAVKATTILTPRRDHIINQLARLGLKSRQMGTAELVKLFYDIYNSGTTVDQMGQAKPAELKPTPSPRPTVPLTRISPNPPVRPQPDIYRPPALTPTAPPPAPGPLSVSHLSPPFIVEELPDDFGP